MNTSHDEWDDRMNIIGQNGNEGLHYLEVPVAYMKGQYPSDPVSHPDHYTKGGIETKDYMIAKYGKQAWFHYCVLNAQKYLSRFMDKGNPRQDLEKCIQYAEWAKEYVDVVD